MERDNKDKGLQKFLNEAEVLFDGNTYKLTADDRKQIESALETAFWDAKERNRRSRMKRKK